MFTFFIIQKQRNATFAYQHDKNKQLFLLKIYVMLFGYYYLTQSINVVTMESEIFFCNQTYTQSWLTDKTKSNGIQYKIIEAIMDLAIKNNGGPIKQEEMLAYSSEIKSYLERRNFRVVPSSGTEMTGNGRGIHHAKYSHTKSVAVLWSVIDNNIYFTFDDHAPIKYHRAIYSFHQLRLGRPVFARKAKCSRKMREILSSKTPWIYKGIDPKERYYYSK
ncbi:hypothetical protein AB4519_15510 [Vibrio splendidus]